MQQEGKTKEAKGSYSSGLKRIIPLHDVAGDEQKEVESLKLLLYLNIAACQMKLKQFDYVIKNCTKALEIENKNIKAFYRRCVALTEINEFERAHQDAKDGLMLENNNQAFTKQLSTIERKWKEKKTEYQNMMKNCFNGRQKEPNDCRNDENLR